MMTTSAEGLQLIEDSELFEAKLYNCPAGHCTIGFGTLVHKGPCCGDPSETPFRDGITRERAASLLRMKVAACECEIRVVVKVALDQSEFDALVDFEYNLGEGALRNSTLLQKMNAGDYDGAAEEFGRWVYANHHKLSGLAVRRAKEKALFTRDLPREVVGG
jgi:GH24 family phage-related lysozyme (muramidase)